MNRVKIHANFTVVVSDEGVKGLLLFDRVVFPKIVIVIVSKDSNNDISRTE